MRRFSVRAACTLLRICKAVTAHSSTIAALPSVHLSAKATGSSSAIRNSGFYTGHGTGMLDPLRNLAESSISELIDDRTTPGRASVMATFDVGGGSASWGLSAKPEVKLAALMEITNGLAQTFSVEDILPKLLDSLFKIFVQADRGFVVMPRKVDGPPVVVADKSRRPGDESRMRISRTIVEEAMTLAKSDPFGRCRQR